MAPLRGGLAQPAPESDAVKIAPMLQHFVAARTCHQGECGGDAECETVAEELRALLAVAKAARRAADDYEEEDYGLHRALTRLEKVSTP